VIKVFGEQSFFITPRRNPFGFLPDLWSPLQALSTCVGSFACSPGTFDHFGGKKVVVLRKKQHFLPIIFITVLWNCLQCYKWFIMNL
jgi:hypothetical protein